jgi:hypothetical protein
MIQPGGREDPLRLGAFVAGDCQQRVLCLDAG